MMKEKRKPKMPLFLCSLSMLFAAGVKGQLSFSGQLRTRTEFRDGLGTLLPKTSEAAVFTSQRTRLRFGYHSSRINFQASVQDIRVWGQDASTISNADGSRLGVHEAWAELVLANKTDSVAASPSVDYFGIKIGRQELVYDDSRLLGNLDWMQQGRRHDAIIFKLRNNGWQLDLGNAFNQNTDAFNYNGTYYTPANLPPYVKDNRGNLAPTPPGMIPLINAAGLSLKTGTPALQTPPSTNGLNQDYKALQYLYAAKQLGATKLTGLVVADHFGRYSLDSVKNIAGTDTSYIYGRRFNRSGVNSRVTAGLYATSTLNSARSLLLTAGFYYQAGKDRDAQSLSAYTSTFALTWTRGKLTWTAGWDYVSGNNAFSPSTVNHRFDPLYGTPHKFWGTMDYFYAGTGSPAGGLNNPYIKARYNSKNTRFSTGLDCHYFALASYQRDNKGNALPKYIGAEFDWQGSYSLSSLAALECGFSVMAASKSMEYAKGITPGTSKLTGTWAYLMINIKPDFIFK